MVDRRGNAAIERIVLHWRLNMARETHETREAGEIDAVAGLTFEAAASELERLIDQIESGEIGIEDSLKAYERGIRLRDHCRAILARTEQRVIELNPGESGRSKGVEGNER